MEFNILTITNKTGNINKNFSLLNDEVYKTSSAKVYDATFVENTFNTLEEFDKHILSLAPNQAISLGKSVHNLTKGNIVTKGNENISTGSISRSNQYMTVQDNIQLCLGDIDPDEQMSEYLQNINTPDKIYESLNKLHGDSFKNVSVRAGYGSSTGIFNFDTNEQIYSSDSMHFYWLLKNVNNKNINKYIEYLKRKAVELNLWYLKIHKDGSTSYRTLLDLSVIKSLQSRFVFEAPPSVGEGLVRITPDSKFYNTSNDINNEENIYDLEKVSYKNLPDWKIVYEKEKEKRKDDIKKIKKVYRAEKITELVQTNLLSNAEASLIIDEYLFKNTISASMILTGANNANYRVYNFLTQDTKSWDIFDIFDYKKGLGKTYVNVNNLFDATIYTYLRGGVTYNISFTLNEIFIILNTIDFSRKGINKILTSLIKYIVENEFNKDDIESIIKFIANKECKFEFEKNYYKNYIEHEVLKRMSNYAFMMLDGKTGLIKLDEDIDLTLYTTRSVKDKFLNNNFNCKDPNKLTSIKEINVVDYWMKSKHRKDYESVTFTDEDTSNTLKYNLFKGFNYTPIYHEDVDIQIFFNCILEVICNNDEFFYNIVLAFIAQIIQDPMNKLGTSLIIYGEKRIGKGSFIKLLGELIGSNHYFQTSQADKVFGRFNIQLLRSVLVYLNEAFWSGDKSMEGRIKSLISDDEMSYEIKGGAVFGDKNVTRLILDSNEKYIVPATYDEGRYICLSASSSRKGDLDFLGKVNNLRHNQKAMEKIMYFFMNFDYKPYEKHLREAPKSELFIEQVMQNFTKIQEWWYRNLSEGDIYNSDYIKDADGIKISNEELWNSFKLYHKGKTTYDKQASFYSDFKNLTKGCILNNNIKVNNGKNGKLIANLKICKDKFKESTMVSSFDDNSEWNTYTTLASIVSPYKN